jgi:TRAP-type C4-dicarboxylate transport system permease small subunit
MRFVLRAALLAAGVGFCAIGLSAASKLFRETLDSSRWEIGGLALIYFVGGVIAIIAVITDVRRRRAGRTNLGN